MKLEEGELYTVTTIHHFRGRFAGVEVDKDETITHYIFDEGSRGVGGEPTLRIVRASKLARAVKVE